jgi:ribosomal protein S18 acetylase RimI-like enzyme
MSGPMIEAFTPADQDAVRALVLDGLRERWGGLDPSLNADLDDIARSYAGAVVLVARLDDRVVGTGTLVLRPEAGEIVRMAVAADVRRRGIGRALVDALLDAARARALTQVVLETTAEWTDAVGFYEGCGFACTHVEIGRFGRDVHLAHRL